MGGTPPQTLPADFFTGKKPKDSAAGPPKTLPADFFSGKKAKAPTSSPKAEAAAPTPKPAQPSAAEKDPLVQYTQQVQKMRPRWDTPNAILQDPTWYGRSARYFGGELVGAGKAGAAAVGGGAKLLHDVASAVNPFEEDVTPLSRVKQVGKDVKEGALAVKDVAKGVWDIDKAVWDLISHFSTADAGALADPEHFGQTVANAAAIVDGGVKSAKAFAEKLKLPPEAATEAARVANRASSGVPSRFFQRKAFEDVYVHTKGLDVAKKIGKAAKEVNDEVKAHASNIADKVDTQIPSGVIDAAAEAKTIAKEFEDVVKTPDKYHPALAQMAKDTNKVPPGQWSWEKTRQFRSSIGRAMGNAVGPQKAVLTRVYRDLTTKLANVAKKYKLEDSWNHYNELERKSIGEFGDLLDKVRESQSGKEVHSHLAKDTALTGEMLRNLKKYGLKDADILKFVKDGTRIAKQQSGWKGSLFRMAYGTPVGIPVMLMGRLAGLGWIGSVGAGALAGYASSHLINMARALKLSPEVIEHILSERELPGKMKLGKGVFPEGESGPPKLEAPLPKEPDEPGGEPEDERIRRLSAGAKPALPKTPEEIKGEADRKATKEAEEALKPKKIPEGQHGKGKLAEQAKAIERITKNREKAKRGAQAEATEATARAQATDMDVSKLQIPEMEEALRSMEPVAWSALQKARKAKLFAEQDYEPYLREMILHAYEKRGGNKAAD